MRRSHTEGILALEAVKTLAELIKLCVCSIAMSFTKAMLEINKKLEEK